VDEFRRAGSGIRTNSVHLFMETYVDLVLDREVDGKLFELEK
jgi:hypothetical protein